MNAMRATMSIAGLFIMLSLALGHYMGQIDMTQVSWLWFTAFVGANLFQAGITNFCPLTKILRAVGVN